MRDEGGQWAQATASQPHKTQHDNEMGSNARAAAERRAEEEDEEDGPCMPGSFDFEDHDNGAARASTVDPLDAVGMLGNLWRRMQVRWWCGQEEPFVRFGFSSHLELVYVLLLLLLVLSFFFLLVPARFGLIVS